MSVTRQLIKNKLFLWPRIIFIFCSVLNRGTSGHRVGGMSDEKVVGPVNVSLLVSDFYGYLFYLVVEFRTKDK